MVATVRALRIPQNLHLPRTLPVNGRAEHGPVCFGPVGTKKGKPERAAQQVKTPSFCTTPGGNRRLRVGRARPRHNGGAGRNEKEDPKRRVEPLSEGAVAIVGSDGVRWESERAPDAMMHGRRQALPPHRVRPLWHDHDGQRVLRLNLVQDKRYEGERAW